MKVIDLLNKIANGEIEYEQKIKIDNEIITVSNLLGAYIFNKKRLNDKVEILEEPRDIEVCGSLFTKSEYDKLAHREEENKIPEKIEFYIDTEKTRTFRIISPDEIAIKINEIIDYLKSKGE